jgi:hypothetical protein
MAWPPKTIQVTRNSDPETVRVINEIDFDSATMTVYEKVDEPKKRGPGRPSNAEKLAKSKE